MLSPHYLTSFFYFLVKKKILNIIRELEEDKHVNNFLGMIFILSQLKCVWD